MTAPTVQERVAAGAVWLDEHEPGWWQRINLDALRMESCEWCVLGQVFGHFDEAPRAGRPASHLGFDFLSEGDLWIWDDWDALEKAWRDLITARRAAVSTVVGAS